MSAWIVSANALTSGTVVYYTDNGWSDDIRNAATAIGDEAKTLLAATESAVRDNRVVEPYLVEVEQRGGELRPLRLREQLRERGPSVARKVGGK